MPASGVSSDPTASDVMQRIWDALDGPAMATSNADVLNALCMVLMERRNDLAVRGLRDEIIDRAYAYYRDSRGA